MAGNRTPNFEDAKSSLLIPLWLTGWSLLYTWLGTIVALGIVGYFLESTAILVFLGIFAGPIVWFIGARYVNDNYRDVLDAYLRDVEGRGREILGLTGEDVASYTLQFEGASPLMVSAAKEYQPTTLIVTDSSVAVYDDTNLNMMLLQADVGTDTREMYYDQISSVNYSEPYLELKTSDGDTMQYLSSRKPNDALHDIQDRLRGYKRTGATA